MISLVQLEYAVAVDTYRHFVTASEKCFVTQPTLSMQIKKMEEELEVMIFDRSKHPIVPTEIGEKIIAQARVIIAESKKIKELVNDSKTSVTGELTIGIIPSLAPYLLPLFIGNFTKKYPDVHLKVIELLTEDIVTEMKKDLIDVGILVTPLNEKGIFEEPIFYEKMLLYVNNENPLASKAGINTLDIATPDLWLLSKGHCFRSQVINLCSYQADSKEDLPFEYESGSLETLKRFVEKEGGYTLLPELSVGDDVKNSSSTIKEFNTTPIREVSLVYSRNYTKRRLLDLIAEEIKYSLPIGMLNKNRGQIVEWK